MARYDTEPGEKLRALTAPPPTPRGEGTPRKLDPGTLLREPFGTTLRAFGDPQAPLPPAVEAGLQDYGAIPSETRAGLEAFRGVASRGPQSVAPSVPVSEAAATKPPARPVARGGGGVYGSGAPIGGGFPQAVTRPRSGFDARAELAKAGVDVGEAPEAAEAAAPLTPEQLKELYFTDQDAYRSALESMRLSGQLTSGQVAREEQRLESLPGLQIQLAQHQLEGERLQTLAEERQLRIHADAQAEYARQLAEAQQFEKDELEKARIRIEVQGRGEDIYRERIEEADRRVEEFRIGDKRGGGERAMDMFAAALAQFASTLTRDPSIAQNVMGSIEAKLDRNFKAQESQLSSLTDRAGRVRNDLHAYRQAFGDKEQAHMALRARYYGGQEQAARATAARMQDRRAQAVVLGIADEFANKRDQMITGVKLRITQQEMVARAAQAQADAERRRAESEMGQPIMSGLAGAEEARLWVPQAQGYAGSAEQKSQAIQAFTQLAKGKVLLGELQALRQKPLSEWSPQDRAKYESLRLQFGPLNNVVLQQGAMAAEEGKRFNEQMPDLSVLDVLGTDAIKTDTMAGIYTQWGKTVSSNLGVRPGLEPIPTTDKKGQRQYIIRELNPAVKEQAEAEEQQKEHVEEFQGAIKALREGAK